MRIKEGFVVREVVGETIVLPTGDKAKLNMVISLNDTGAFLWRKMEQENTEESLVSALLEEYDVDELTAKNNVNAFIATLRANGFLET